MGYYFLAIGLVGFAFAIHPFVTYPLTLELIAWLRPKPLRPTEASPPPTVALCLCVYNEEPILEAKIANMLALRRQFPQLEILVYVDASTDRSAEIVSGFEGQIRAFFAPSRTGKTHGMNLLVGSTAADVIVFTDANVLFAPDALTHLLRPFADPEIGCVLGHLEYVTPVGTATASTGTAYWRLEERIKALETLSGSAITADGAIFAIRRIHHRPPPPSCADDIFLSLSVLCAGYRVVRAGDAIAYEDIGSNAQQEFRRKVRIACIAYNAHRLLWPQLRSLPWLELYKYVSHKLLRWYAGVSLLVAALSIELGIALLSGWIVALATAGAGLLALLAIWRAERGPLGQLGSVLRAFAATALGVWDSYRGKTFITWASPTRLSFNVPGKHDEPDTGLQTEARSE